MKRLLGIIRELRVSWPFYRWQCGDCGAWHLERNRGVRLLHRRHDFQYTGAEPLQVVGGENYHYACRFCGEEMILDSFLHTMRAEPTMLNYLGAMGPPVSSARTAWVEDDVWRRPDQVLGALVENEDGERGLWIYKDVGGPPDWIKVKAPDEPPFGPQPPGGTD